MVGVTNKRSIRQHGQQLMEMVQDIKAGQDQIIEHMKASQERVEENMTTELREVTTIQVEMKDEIIAVRE